MACAVSLRKADSDKNQVPTITLALGFIQP